MKGKEKCKILKEIRAKIASENDIAFVVSECLHQGDCLGTCPKCEAELRYLERELAVRKNLGKAVAVIGLSSGICMALTACSPVEALQDLLGKGSGNDVQEQLSGDVPYYPEEENLHDDNQKEGSIPDQEESASPEPNDITAPLLGYIAIEEPSDED